MALGLIYIPSVGPESSVGIMTRFGLDGPVIESRWVRDFSTRVQTDPRAPPNLLYNGYRVFPAGKALTTQPHLALRLKNEYTYTSTPPLRRRGLF